MKKPYHLLLTAVALLIFLMGCASDPETIEITRVVNEEVPVTVEVTRIVTEETSVEVPVTVEVPVEVPVEVEVTRVVEVVLTATPATEAGTTDAAATEEAAATDATPAATNIYTVVDGDSWALISFKTQTPVSEIRAANGMERPTRLFKGMELTIPGWDGVPLTVYVPGTPTASSSSAPVTAVVVGANLLPNPSFEGDRYFFNGVQEWQIAEGYSLAVDEGPNTLEPGDKGNFIRPEVRVLSSASLPPGERGQFVLDGDKTIKIFKGGAPIHYAIFTDVRLEPGDYRFVVRYFPDVVSVYENNEKVWATNSLAAEVRIIQGAGGTGWIPVTPGQEGSLFYDFTVDTARTVRLGADFRNRFVNHNNGWFVDHWTLEKLETP